MYTVCMHACVMWMCVHMCMCACVCMCDLYVGVCMCEMDSECVHV